MSVPSTPETAVGVDWTVVVVMVTTRTMRTMMMRRMTMRTTTNVATAL
jgi:hypothetical protein